MFGVDRNDRVSPLSALVLVGCLALALGFGYVALRAYATLVFPYQVDPEEGFVLNQAMLLAKGESIYRPIDKPPFIAGTYAPLYPYVAGRAAAILIQLLLSVAFGAWVAQRNNLLLAGLSVVVFFSLCEIFNWLAPARLAGLAAATMPAARALAVVCELLCGFIVGLCVWLMGRRNFLAAIFAGLLFFISGETYNWTGFARVDFMALSLNLLGLLLLTFEERGVAFLVLSGLCFTAALFTKQSQIMAPVAGCLYLLWRRPRRGLIFALSLGAAVAAIAGVLDVLTQGQYLIHTVIYNANKLDWGQFFIYLRHLWRFGFLIWVALAFAAGRHVLMAVYLKRAGESAVKQEAEIDAHARPDWFQEMTPSPRRLAYEADWTPFFLIPCLLSLAGFTKAGVSYNYMLDPWAAVCLYVGVRIGRELTPGEWLRLRPHRALSVGRAFGIAAVVFSVAYSFFILTPLERSGQPWKEESAFRPRFTMTANNPGPTDVEKGKKVEQAIKKVLADRGAFLSELPIFEIRAQKPVVWQPFIMAQLAKEGKWDDRPMVERFARKEYDLLVATKPFEEGGYYANYTERMLEAIRGAYRLSETATGGPHIFEYYLYVPKR